ncbi:MAG: hypothetical protein ACFFC3_16150 [Candidatus Odinarchaeota archaeon]
MEFIDNLKKLGKDWKLLVIVIWMLVGIALIPVRDPPIVSLIGIIIYFPFLVFLMYLFLLSLISKKDIFEYPTWKIILLLVLSLPIMLLISIILIALFLISVITYFFFTSWFILYGCFLTGKNVDNRLSKIPKAKPFIRTLIFIGGLGCSITLLYLFQIIPTIIDLSVITDISLDFPWYLDGVFILIGAILVGFAIIIIIYNFKKVFNGWFGIFAILVTFYTLFLALKIHFYGAETEPEGYENIWAYFILIVPDMIIIFYSLSMLMGSQAELLSKRIKRFGLDTVIIWLILSKVTYEFIHYFPYDELSFFNFPLIQWFAENIDNDLINHIKNIAVLVFFVLLLIIIGIYEIRKYSRKQLKLPELPEIDRKETITLQPTTEDHISPYEETELISEESKITEDERTSSSVIEDTDNDYNYENE